MSWHVSPWVYPVWGSLHFLDFISFSMLGKFSTIISSNIFSVPFFFSSSSGTPIIQKLVHLMFSQRSLRLSSVLFILLILFSLFCSAVVFSTILCSRSLIRSSPSVIVLFIPSREFLIYLFCCSSLYICSFVLQGPCYKFILFSPFYFQDFGSS